MSRDVNLALWLDRAGRDDPQRPALGLGARVLRSYGEIAGRVARLAGALRALRARRPATASPSSPRTARTIVEMLYAIWHAGLAAVPANAKLHGAELGYILEQSGARVCFASDGLDGEIAPHAPQSLERLIVIGGAEYERLFAADPIAVVPRDGDDLAWLFYTSGTTGRPKGAMLTHRVLAAASDAYLRRGRYGFARRSDPARRADEPRLRPLHHGARHAARRQRRAGIRRLRAGGNLRAVPRLAAHLDVRGADHGQAAGREPGGMPEREHPHHRLGRRADVCRGRAEGARPLRAAARADLRPGRKPDDDHDAVARTTSPTATIRAGASGWPRSGGRTAASR